MEIIFLNINFRFIIYVTATVIISYENSVENEPFRQLIMMILHIFSLRGSAHLYLMHCLPRIIYDFTFYLSTLKLSE